MFKEINLNSSIPNAFNIQKENGGEGDVVWVPKVKNAYYVDKDEIPINLSDCCGGHPPNFTQEQLDELIEKKEAVIVTIK